MFAAPAYGRLFMWILFSAAHFNIDFLWRWRLFLTAPGAHRSRAGSYLPVLKRKIGGGSWQGEAQMLDALMVVLGLASFALLIGYVVLCDNL